MNRNIGTQNKKNLLKSRRGICICIFCFLSVFFFAMLIVYGIPVYNDSKQYMDMHVHREPVYPLFLWLTRLLAGENSLMLAGIMQCILAIYASYRFITYILDNFYPSKVITLRSGLIAGLLTLIVITPYIITPLMSSTHVMLATGILSESLSMTLFLLFFIYSHKMLVKRDDDGHVMVRYIVAAWSLAFVLSLTRSQMIVTLIAWAILSTISFITSFVGMKHGYGDSSKGVIKRKIGALISSIAAILLVLLISIPVRTAVIKFYNHIFNERYVDNVYSNVTMLSNIFYVTDGESAELIDDADLKDIFLRLYDVMDDNEWSYAYAGDSVADRAIYLEEMHDNIKFDVLEAGFRDIMNERGMHEYIDYNLKAEEYSGKLIRILWPECIGKWFADWMIMGLRGVVRSIAVCRFVAYLYVAAVIAYMIYAIICMIKRSGSSTAYLGVIALLLLLGNAFGTAFTIMCLSRYMIYGFIPFYTALIVLFDHMFYNKRDEKSK